MAKYIINTDQQNQMAFYIISTKRLKYFAVWFDNIINTS